MQGRHLMQPTYQDDMDRWGMVTDLGAAWHAERCAQQRAPT